VEQEDLERAVTTSAVVAAGEAQRGGGSLLRGQRLPEVAVASADAAAIAKPAPGLVAVIEAPAGAGVRVDDGERPANEFARDHVDSSSRSSI
jgi:hypothetical protein